MTENGTDTAARIERVPWILMEAADKSPIVKHFLRVHLEGADYVKCLEDCCILLSQENYRMWRFAFRPEQAGQSRDGDPGLRLSEESKRV